MTDYPQPPKMVEIVRYSIQDVSARDYDYSWIRGEILAVYACEDGVVIIVREETKK